MNWSNATVNEKIIPAVKSDNNSVEITSDEKINILNSINKILSYYKQLLLCQTNKVCTNKAVLTTETNTFNTKMKEMFSKKIIDMIEDKETTFDDLKAFFYNNFTIVRMTDLEKFLADGNFEYYSTEDFPTKSLTTNGAKIYSLFTPLKI
uniref:Uncharacterized protein n=1 Tax=viral metagenome TaxID=1070528 RepID=A0A6C0ECL1_9ZZZZ